MGVFDRKRPSKEKAEANGRAKQSKRQKRLDRDVDKWEDQAERKQRRAGVWPWT